MKDTFYFPHDYNAANDQKVLKLRAKHGNESYAVYFMILEMMAQEDSGILNEDFIEIFCLSYGYPISSANGSANGSAIKEPENPAQNSYPFRVLQTCLDVGLFKKDKKGIYSVRMLEHKKFRQERSLSGRKGANKRWDDGSANSSAIGSAYAKESKVNNSDIEINNNVKDIYNDKNKLVFTDNSNDNLNIDNIPNTIKPLNTIKEKKENPTKEKKESLEFFSFDDFWQLYDKKVGLKAKIKPLWDKLSLKDKQAAFAHIPLYKQAQPDKSFRKNPETYLRNRSWEDEVIERSNKETQNIPEHEQRRRNQLKNFFGDTDSPFLRDFVAGK